MRVATKANSVTIGRDDPGVAWLLASGEPAVRMLTLDSEVEMIEAEAAQTRVFGMGAATP